MEVKKTFLKGINSDDVYYLVDNQEYLGALNMRYTFSEDGNIGAMRTIESNVWVPTNVPSEEVYEGAMTVLGACEDTVNGRTFFFAKSDSTYPVIKAVTFDDEVLCITDVYNIPATGGAGSGARFSLLVDKDLPIGDRIVETIIISDPGKGYQVGDELTVDVPNLLFETTTPLVLTVTEITSVEDKSGDGIFCICKDRLVRKVLLAADVDGGLNFYNDIQSSIIGDMLYWTDDDNHQRRINVEAGLKMYDEDYQTDVVPYESPVAQEVITLIRPQPMLPLIVTKSFDPDYQNNFIWNQSFQFTYRFIYRDYEISAFAPLSELINYNFAGQDFNFIEVEVPAEQEIQQDVLKIEIASVIDGQYRIIRTIKPGGGEIVTAQARFLTSDGLADGTYPITDTSGNTGTGAEFEMVVTGGVPVLSVSNDNGGTGYTADPQRVVWGPLTAASITSNGVLSLFGSPSIDVGDVISLDIPSSSNSGEYLVQSVTRYGSGLFASTQLSILRLNGDPITDQSGMEVTVTVTVDRTYSVIAIVEGVEVSITPLTVTAVTDYDFSFYNDVVGVVVDQISANKPFDAVPIKSKSLSIARNRLFLGNNFDGYESPSKTSLSFELDPDVSDVESITTNWYQLRYWKRYDGGFLGLFLKKRLVYFYAIEIRNTVDDDGWYILKEGQYLTSGGDYNLQLRGGCVDASSINAAGTSYVAGDVLTNEDNLQIKILTVDTGGEVLTYEIINSGYGYTASSVVDTWAGSTGTGFELSITSVSTLPKKVPLTSLTKIGDRLDRTTQINAFQYHELWVNESTNTSPQQYGFWYYGSDSPDRFFGQNSNTPYTWPEEFSGYSSHQPVSVFGVDDLRTNDGNLPVFKPTSKRFYGTAFYDFAGRFCGVVPSKDPIVIPDREFNETSYSVSATWTLSNADAVNEIPEWAKYYSIVMTKDQTVASFISDRSGPLKYISKNTDGEYQEENTYDTTRFGIGINAKRLYGKGLGYAYNEGDVCRLYVNGGDTYVLKVKDTWGDYIIIDLENIGDLTSPPDADFEVHTPYKSGADDSEVYYEIGQVYKVNAYGTANRNYSTVQGKVDGDCYIISREGSTYLSLAMSPNDLYWKDWNRNLGRVNKILDIKPAQKKVGLCFSNTIVLGTEINGLSSFEYLSETQLPVELGSIQRLQLISKVGVEGTVMLAIGERETCSVYLGETQIVDSSGANAFFASQKGVIGGINVLRGSFGTINPESVAISQGTVYWFDAFNGAVIRYDNNGLVPISRSKMYKYFKRIGEDVVRTRAKVIGGYDPFNDEYLITVPRNGNNVFGIQLVDIGDNDLFLFNMGGESTAVVEWSLVNGKVYKFSYSGVHTITFKIDGVDYDGGYFRWKGGMVITAHSPSPVEDGPLYARVSWLEQNIYEPYDGNAATWAFSPAVEKFTSRYSFIPQYMSAYQNRLVSFYYEPYIHDGDEKARFYGVAYKSGIALLVNESQAKVNVYNAFSVEGDVPESVHFRTEYPNVQSSNLVAEDFRTKEGIHYSAILRDRFSPNVTVEDEDNEYNEKLFSGDRMRGQYMKCMLLYPEVTGGSIRFAGINIIPSSGHNKQSAT